jgi:proteasome activator subunit 4
MSELSDNPELQTHSQAVLYIISAVAPPPESIEAIFDSFVRAISSSTVRAPSSLIQTESMTYLILY